MTLACRTADLLSRATHALKQVMSGQHTLHSADERRSALTLLAVTVHAASRLVEVVHVQVLGRDEVGRKAQTVVEETERIKVETEKISKEVERSVAETGRLRAEADKVAKETERAKADAEKAGKETERAAAETERLKAEAMLVRSDKMRTDADTERAKVEIEWSRREGEMVAKEVESSTHAVREIEEPSIKAPTERRRRVRVNLGPGRVEKQVEGGAQETQVDPFETYGEALRRMGYIIRFLANEYRQVIKLMKTTPAHDPNYNANGTFKRNGLARPSGKIIGL
ncbi:uncharacterized protein LAJ45_10285 [Morchella importuna]|uniref:uncharacterized protein n=1 Tax=Morchella importuna TaxID=1174673 RepID=UPI001E8EE248|nr:uncharacterized protein LAJ45_10285 [Morchella importuna]KAH8145645.1 hypothetical protein LAJ45_10285 [Morchella importuna]